MRARVQAQGVGNAPCVSDLDASLRPLTACDTNTLRDACNRTQVQGVGNTPCVTDLATPLLQPNARDTLTLRDACNGVHRATGSGNTSGSGKALRSRVRKRRDR